MGLRGSKHIISFILFALLLSICPAMSQEDYASETFDRQKWEKARRNLDYPLKKDKKKEREKKESDANKSKDSNRDGERIRDESSPSRSYSPPAGGIWNSSGLKIFMIVLILSVLVILIILILVKNVQRNQKLKTEAAIIESLTEEDAPEELFHEHINQALSEKKFKMLIRIYFIISLKSMAEKGWIIYKKDKTNMTYLSELRSNKHYDYFYQMTLIFESIWYGEIMPSEEDYTSYVRFFEEFINELGAQKYMVK